MDKINFNLCFECNTFPGLACPGLKKGEKTRCQKCFNIFMSKEMLNQIIEELNYIKGLIIINNDLEEAKELIDSLMNLDKEKYSFIKTLIYDECV